MTALVGVRCDGCGSNHIRESVSQVSTTEIRRALRERGWHKTRGTYTTVMNREQGYARDICPVCWKRGVR